MYTETRYADASVVICLLWVYGLARFVFHNDRRSKTSFLYIRPPALPLRANKRCGKDRHFFNSTQTFTKFFSSFMKKKKENNGKTTENDRNLSGFAGNDNMYRKVLLSCREFQIFAAFIETPHHLPFSSGKPINTGVSEGEVLFKHLTQHLP